MSSFSWTGPWESLSLWLSLSVFTPVLDKYNPSVSPPAGLREDNPTTDCAKEHSCTLGSLIRVYVVR